MTPAEAPPPHVLDRFGARGPAVRLAGGTSPVFRAGGIVLKPADDPGEVAWKAPLLARLPEAGFRLGRPVRSAGGAWTVDGWTATRLVTGRPQPLRLDDALGAARAFHAALADRTRPRFLDALGHRWAVAHRVAWEAADVPRHEAADDVLGRLRNRLRPTAGRPQVVHCDLAGNVLFAPGLDPAVIDFSPWWAPTGYAEAILFADAVAWHGADPGDVALFTGVADFAQMLLRALVFRLAAHVLAERQTHGRLRVDVAAYQPVIDLAESRAGDD